MPPIIKRLLDAVVRAARSSVGVRARLDGRPSTGLCKRALPRHLLDGAQLGAAGGACIAHGLLNGLLLRNALSLLANLVRRRSNFNLQDGLLPIPPPLLAAAHDARTDLRVRRKLLLQVAHHALRRLLHHARIARDRDGHASHVALIDDHRRTHDRAIRTKRAADVGRSADSHARARHERRRLAARGRAIERAAHAGLRPLHVGHAGKRQTALSNRPRVNRHAGVHFRLHARSGLVAGHDEGRRNKGPARAPDPDLDNLWALLVVGMIDLDGDLPGRRDLHASPSEHEVLLPAWH
mmetsp:Transcript_31945/g.78385  ORF Transcript_31945/g.78385 Transcript_31945/m.78385 type:complete len:295 (-) Transcript_31945:101-985(-)